MKSSLKNKHRAKQKWQKNNDNVVFAKLLLRWWLMSRNPTNTDKIKTKHWKSGHQSRDLKPNLYKNKAKKEWNITSQTQRKDLRLQTKRLFTKSFDEKRKVMPSQSQKYCFEMESHGNVHHLFTVFLFLGKSMLSLLNLEEWLLSLWFIYCENIECSSKGRS